MNVAKVSFVIILINMGKSGLRKSFFSYAAAGMCMFCGLQIHVVNLLKGDKFENLFCYRGQVRAQGHQVQVRDRPSKQHDQGCGAVEATAAAFIVIKVPLLTRHSWT